MSAGLSDAAVDLACATCLVVQVMGSDDPTHMFTAYVDPGGAYIPEEVQGESRGCGSSGACARGW